MFFLPAGNAASSTTKSPTFLFTKRPWRPTQCSQCHVEFQTEDGFMSHPCLGPRILQLKLQSQG